MTERSAGRQVYAASRSVLLVVALTLLSAGGIVLYNLQQVRGLQAQLLDVQMSLDRLKARTAGRATPASAGEARTGGVSSEDFIALQAEVARLSQASAPGATTGGPANLAVVEAAVGPTDAAAYAGQAVSAAPASASGSPDDPSAGGTPEERMTRVLAQLESQDQQLLKEAVAEVLEDRRKAEREAALRKQAEQLTAELTKVLALNGQQQEQIGQIVRERHKAIEDLRAQTNDQNRSANRARMDQMRQEGEARIRALLTAGQNARYQEWQGKRENKRGGRGGKN